MRLFVATLLVIPRAWILLWVALDPARWAESFPSAAWPVIGALFLPVSTLMVVIVGPGGWDVLDVVLLVAAVVADAQTWGALRYVVRNEAYFRRRRSDQGGAAARPDAEREPQASPARGALGRFAASTSTVRLAIARFLPWPGVRLNAARRRLRAMAAQRDAAAVFTADDDYELDRIAYRSTKASMVASSHLWLLFLFVLGFANNSTISWPGMMLIAVLGPILTIGAILVVGQLNADFRVILPMVELLADVHALPDGELDANRIRRVNHGLERVAGALQRLPVRLGSSHPAVAEAAAKKAAAVRDLQRCASFAAPDAKPALERALHDDVRLLLRGRWDALPDGDAHAQIPGLSTAQKVAFTVLAVAFAAGAAWLAFDHDALGDGTGLAVSALVTASIGSLIKSGVAPGGLQQSVELSQKVRG